jgi:hypothetical protein
MWDNHQHAERGDFGVADGVASVHLLAAFLEKREDGLRLMAQGDGLRVVAGKSENGSENGSNRRLLPADTPR